MDDREQLEKHLDHCSVRVQRNTTVVTPEDLRKSLGFEKEGYTGQHMLHISTNTNIRKFIPSLTLRGAPTECRDITRVYVAPHLLGCMLGYAAVETDFFEYASDGEEKDYKGGYKIYALPFSAALKPNKSMVPDQAATDEHWMVSYSPATVEYTPVTAGRFFCSNLQYFARSKKDPAGRLTLFVEVVLDEGIPFSKNFYLKKGYWKIEGTVNKNTEGWRHDQDFTVEPITKGEYMGEKVEKAALLSYDNPMIEWAKS